MNIRHQYVDRESNRAVTEKLFGDRLVNLAYTLTWERAPVLFSALTSARMSDLLAYLTYDQPITGSLETFLGNSGIDVDECLDPPSALGTLRKIFERKIRYWECRPMLEGPAAVASPADSRVLVGSFRENAQLFIKEKFFNFEELLGEEKSEWMTAFAEGDFAVFRLTPDKYHYNHTPVAGQVLDLYEIPGAYHSCNPSAIVMACTPYSKNKRVVTVIDTDVPGGTQVGLVAMIEVVALMVGEVVQAYSEERYDDPQPITPGMMVRKGVPKSLYRPGSSTDVLLFQQGRVRFAEDLTRNMYRSDVTSRFSRGFGRPLVETDVRVRSLIAVSDPNGCSRNQDAGLGSGSRDGYWEV
jgi:phosphatidylserine decarboxylase